MANSFNFRQDADNYQEGYSVADAIEVGLGKYSWLIPGVTCTLETMTNSGVLQIPKISGTQGAATAICADGDAGDADIDYLNIIIDRKVTGKFDGCFTLAQIAGKKEERALNNYKLKNMQNDFQDDILATLVADSVDATAKYTSGTTKPSDYLLSLKSEYFAANEEEPTIALISNQFYEDVIKEFKDLATPLGDETLVAGAAGRAMGLLLRPVPRLTTNPVIVYTPDALYIAKPSTTAQISEKIIGDVDDIADNFFNGYLAMVDKRAIAGTASTYVHKFYGKGIPIEAKVLKGVDV